MIFIIFCLIIANFRSNYNLDYPITHPLQTTLMIKTMIKTNLILILLPLVFGLKVSEVGVNDWHIEGVGEIRHAQLSRTKLFIQNRRQGIIGLVNKLDGSFQGRITVGQGQKIVSHSDKEITIATRNNQLLTYSLPTLTATTSNKYINNNFTNNRIQSILSHKSHEYLLLARSLLIDGEQHPQIKANKDKGQRFVKLYELNDQIHVITHSKQGDWCIIKVESNQTRCWNNLGDDLEELHIYKGNVVLAFEKNTEIIDIGMNQVKVFAQGLIDVVQGVLVFEDQSFNLDTMSTTSLRPIPFTSQLSSSLPIYLSQSSEEFHFLKETHPLPSISKQNNVHVLRAWLNYKTEYEYEVLVQFSDLRTVMYEIGREVKVKWEKEESLSYVKGVVFMKYRGQDGLDNEYHRRLLAASYKHLPIWERIGRIPEFLALRLNEEIHDLTFFIGYTLSHLGAFIQSATAGSISFSKFKMSPEQELHYGLRQQIITWTSKNTLFGIDSKNHQIQWKKHLGQDKSIVGMLKLKRDYQTDAAIIVTYDQKEVVIQEISQEGTFTQLHSMSAQSAPTIYQLNDHSLLLKIGKQVHRYELVKSESQEDFKSYYFYSIQGKEVTGWKTQNSETVPVWNFYIPQNHKLAGSASSFRGEHMARIPLYENDKVFFKNVDFTNLALLTTQSSTLHLFILNGMTGQVQFNEYKTAIDTKQPINLAYDENNVLVTYYNSRNKCFQVWTVEGYLSRIQNSAIGMIKDYVEGKEYKPEQNRQNIIFVSAVYGSLVPIKHMFISQSKQSLIRRNMLVITRDNKLYSIGRELISTRRPRKDGPPSFFSNQKYPQYNYFLPYQPIAFFSYDLPLSTLTSIHVAPSDMESSIFLFAHGIDCFMMRVAPDRTFDTMTEDFNQNILLLILVAVTIGILWMRNLVNKAKLKKPHIE